MKNLISKETNNKIQFLIFLIIGTIALGVGIALIVTGINKLKTQVEIKSTIVSIDSYMENDETHYEVVIAYTYDGKDYTDTLGSYSSSWDEGDTLKVYIDPDNPGETSQPKSTMYIGIGLSAFGLIFDAVGIGTLVKENKKKKEMEESDRTNRFQRTV